MSRSLSIRHWQNLPANHSGVAVVFDIFRCSTTIHCLAAQKKGPLFIAPSLEIARNQPAVKTMRVFSELSQPIDCIERFDNSPRSAANEPWREQRPSLVATTTGTPGMFAAQNYRKVYIGSLVNFSSLIAELNQLNEDITLIPAAYPEWQHVEDEIVAQAVATALEGFADMPDFVNQCATSAKEKILASHRIPHLEKKLRTGPEDIQICLDIDRFRQILWADFSNASMAPLFPVILD